MRSIPSANISYPMIRRFPVDISITAGGCITAALTVLILPLPWLASIFLAAFIHEVCHLICLKLCRTNIYRIHIDTHGAVMETAALSPFQEMLCAAAGPVGSFLCLLFSRHFPMLALCGFLQGIYNLLPIYPLDGGRILNAIMELLTPTHAEHICGCVSKCAVFCVMMICLILYLKTYIPLFLFFAGIFLLRYVRHRKTPCNGGQN